MASDPHLTNSIPSYWTINHLSYKDNQTGELKEIFGGSHPGIPKIVIGRSDEITWGITSSLSDVTDLYKEEID